MTGKALKETTIGNYFKAYNEFVAKINAEIRSRRSPLNVTIPQFGSSPSSSTIGVSSNFLPVPGGSMIGPLALLNKQILIDINNSIDISSLSLNSITNESTYTSNVFIDILGSASSQLDTIVGAAFDGQILIVKGSGQPQIITQNIALSIDNIVGNGVDNIITVTVNAGTGSVLSTNNKINITATSTFDKTDVEITKTGADTFTYDLGSIGSTTPDTNGQVLRGNVQTYDGKDIVVTGADTFKAWILVFDNILSNATTQGLWRVLTPPIGTGGTGVQFPIRPPVTNVVATTGNIQLNLNNTSGHYFTIGPLTGNIDIDILNPPLAGIAQAFRINIIKGATDFTVTFNDTLLVQPLIGTANSTTLLAGDIYDGSTFNIFTMTSTAGSGGAGEFFGPWTANHDSGAKSQTNLATLQIVDTGSGSRGSLSGDATLGLVLSTASAGKLTIQDVSTPIAEFKNSVGLEILGSHVIKMNKNIINTLGVIQFDRTAGFSPSTIDSIGFDITLNAMNYNVGLTTDVHTFRAAGELLASITRIGSNLGQITASAIIGSNVLQANEVLFLSTFTNSSPSNGDIWRDTISGNFQFRENGNTVELGGASPLTTKGDLFVFSTVDARLPVGTNGQVLTADSSEALGVKWLAAGAASQTPWGQNIDADGFDLLDFGELNFRNGGVGANNETWIASDGLFLRRNVSFSDAHLWSVDGNTKLLLSTTKLTSSVQLDMNSLKIIGLQNPTTNQDAVTKFYHDNTPVNTGTQDGELWQAQTQTVFDIWLSNSKTGASTTSLNLLNNTLVYIPIYLGERIRISQLALQIKSAPVINPSINFALYDSHPLENYPRTRLDTASDLPGASFVGVVDTSNDIIQDLEPGLYWIGISTDVTIPGIAAFSEGDTISVGYQRNTAGNDSFENVLSFQAVGTSFPSTAASNMVAAIGSVTHAIFVETTFNPN